MIPSSIQCLAQCGSNCPVFARLAVLPLLFADHTSGIRTGLRDYRAKPDAVPLTLQNRKTYRAPFVFAKVRLFLCNVTAQVIAIPALKRYPACTPSSSSVLPRVCMYTAPRIYLPDLPARVSDLVGVLTGTKCLPEGVSSTALLPVRAGEPNKDQVTLRLNYTMAAQLTLSCPLISHEMYISTVCPMFGWIHPRRWVTCVIGQHESISLLPRRNWRSGLSA
jgi:hypothetical protein